MGIGKKHDSEKLLSRLLYCMDILRDCKFTFSSPLLVKIEPVYPSMSRLKAFLKLCLQEDFLDLSAIRKVMDLGRSLISLLSIRPGIPQQTPTLEPLLLLSLTCGVIA